MISMNPATSNVVDLTKENILRHEALQGARVVYIHESEPERGADMGIYMIGGGITSLSAARPRTCGIALAMVAIFCYFPGISMTASVTTSGLTNNSVIGIVFVSIAVTLTVTSGIMCIRSRQLALKLTKDRQQSSDAVIEVCTNASHCDAAAPLISSRDDLIVKAKKTQIRDLKSCNDVDLTCRSAQSFVLKRYFEHLYSETGPFALDREQMDELNRNAMRGFPVSLSHALEDKTCGQCEKPSSNDSAIEISSSSQSLEAGIVI